VPVVSIKNHTRKLISSFRYWFERSRFRVYDSKCSRLVSSAANRAKHFRIRPLQVTDLKVRSVRTGRWEVVRNVALRVDYYSATWYSEKKIFPYFSNDPNRYGYSLAGSTDLFRFCSRHLVAVGKIGFSAVSAAVCPANVACRSKRDDGTPKTARRDYGRRDRQKTLLAGPKVRIDQKILSSWYRGSANALILRAHCDQQQWCPVVTRYGSARNNNGA